MKTNSIKHVTDILILIFKVGLKQREIKIIKLNINYLTNKS